MESFTEATPLTASDEEVIRRVLAGEKHSFEIVMRRYNQRLYRISMSIVANSTEAEDVLQASYLKAYEHLADFGFRSGFGTWITRIVINESLQALRKRKRSPETGITEEHEALEQASPLQTIMNTELRTILEGALSELPEKYRLVFVMREVENMSVDETRETLNITESNVKVRLNRAKEMLRHSLSQHYKTEELYGFHLTRCDRVVRNVLAYINNH